MRGIRMKGMVQGQNWGSWKKKEQTKRAVGMGLRVIQMSIFSSGHHYSLPEGDNGLEKPEGLGS